MHQVSIVIGAQWGDEGKGKWVDILAEDVDIVARYQGGNNAGHTLYIGGEKTVLHQIPSGIFRPHQKCALTAGVVVNPSDLVDEIATVKARLDFEPERLWISARAHVISPWSRFLDGQSEGRRKKPIGTTKRGIGPTYAQKAGRSGIRMGDYIKTTRRLEWIETMKADCKEFEKFFEEQKAEWDMFESSAESLAQYVCDAEAKLRHGLKDKKKILFEGAQGALLDIDHGTYPYVTSSSTAAGGASASVGFSPKKISRILGVAKAYLTRVGEGPFPTELKDEAGRHLAEKGHEFGATTGRARRCGWLDIVALRYAADVNGLDEIILNKLDIMTGLKEVKVAVAYQHPNLGRIDEFPWDLDILKECTPIYVTMPGWDESIPQHGYFEDLPVKARAYVKEVEKLVGVPVTMVGTGVNRGDALFASKGE